MVSPTKPTAVGTPAYSAVPNAEGSPTFDQSPDPNRASVGYSDNQFLSPDADTHMLRPQSGTYPAPSIISRNRDSVMGTPDNRSSWGSNAAFAAAGAGAAVSLNTYNLESSLTSRADQLPLEVNPTYNTNQPDGTTLTMIEDSLKKMTVSVTSPPLLLLLVPELEPLP